MTEVILDKMGTDDDFQTLTEFVEQQVAFFRNLQRVLADNEQLRQQVAERDEVIRKQEEALEQQKKGDEWASRVTYEGVVEQIAACEDAKERDEARKLIEPLLKKSQVTQFRRDIKRRVKELNEEGDAYSDKLVAQVLEASAGKGLIIDAKWKWAGAYWLLRWACNYPVDAKDFCKKIGSLEMDIAAEYECSYESIRKICTLSFMDYDPRRMDSVRVSKNDQGMFSQCREIVLKLVDELEKNHFPQE